MTAWCSNHIAAILVFSGPLFYIGLLMVIFPASIARFPESVVFGLRNFVTSFVASFTRRTG